MEGTLLLMTEEMNFLLKRKGNWDPEEVTESDLLPLRRIMFWLSHNLS